MLYIKFVLWAETVLSKFANFPPKTMFVCRKLLRRIKNLPSGIILFLIIFTLVQLLRPQVNKEFWNVHATIERSISDDGYTLNTNVQCNYERRDFVYVKMIKCASETLASMFRRFGLRRNLSFVLPVGRKIYVGWPHQIRDDMYRHTDTNRFNILVDHAIYNKSTMKTLMTPDKTCIRFSTAEFEAITTKFLLVKRDQGNKLNLISHYHLKHIKCQTGQLLLFVCMDFCSEQ